MQSILVTGAEGQVGKELKEISAKYSALKYIFYNKEQWPIDDEYLSNQILLSERPKLVLNLAAYTKVDQAEEEIKECLKINRDAAISLSKSCANQGIKFIQISSDYVFNEQDFIPIKTATIKKPQGIYAISKSQAEDGILRNNNDALIIRSSWIYSSYGHNFVKTMLKLAEKNQEIRVVNDQIGSPTYAADLAGFLNFITVQYIHFGKWNPGIFHYANQGQTSWFDFAIKIFLLGKINIKTIPIKTSEYITKAIRPKYSVLDCSDTIRTFGLEIPFWEDSLQICIDKILQGNGI
ncbi:MAG: dTDP-4-dehydrorhamnose reductase [Saprospiraceae bacterium]|nr:dTDP-4-dehydrorhamnose reductase [Saprospiraceae bacterium]MBK7812314.1 dTDP-4-dehydrorhamnose reductase [Saprospiraceae bacterium]MBK9632461.1 dTDP-4-dehydrorhamnose reductase [Saprospiraceae bacterium]